MNTNTLILQQARQAIQTGSMGTARRLLAHVLRAEPRNLEAWLLMSSAVQDREKQRDCLLKVLTLDPDNAAARAGLQWLQNPAAHTADRSRQPGETLLDRLSEKPGEPTLPPPLPPPHGAPSVSAGARPTVQALAAAATPIPIDPDERMRQVGQRNVMLAGGLIFSLLCGLLLLIITLVNIVP